MLSVFLIDDEERILHGLQHIIDWEACGFAVAGAFSDSREAIGAAGRLRPDLIVTDIEMPDLSGLELIASLRDRLPRTRFVILSAHDRFHYAQQALHFGAFRYILKPIDKNELLQVLGDARAALSSLGEQERLSSELHQEKTRRESYLRSLIVREAVCDGLHRRPEEQDALYARLYESFAFRLVLLQPQPAGGKAAMDAVARELSDRLPQAVLFRHEDCLVLVQERPGGPDPASFSRQLGELTGAPVACGVTGELLGLEQAHAELLRACSRFKRRLFFQPAAAVCVPLTGEEPPGQDRALIPLLEDAKRRLPPILFQSDLQLLSEYCDGMFSQLSSMEASVSPAAVHGFCQELLNLSSLICRRVCRPAGGAPAPVQLPQLCSLTEYRRYAQSLLEKELRETAEAFGDSGSHIVSQVKLYIHEHYAEPDLKLKKLADSYYVNYTYFSHLFHKKTGVTFSAYLTEVRVEEAKRLLEHSSLSVSEISKRVGFRDAQSFFYVFRRLCGQSPKAWRQRPALRPPHPEDAPVPTGELRP